MKRTGLDKVIITDELERRPVRAPDLQAESQALHALARELTATPRELLDRLAAVACNACQAGSAGVSVLAALPTGEQIFRGDAIAGDWAGYVGESAPVEFSPSGTCLARGAPQLYSYPARYFTYLGTVNPPLVEGLFVPWSTPDGPLGTIWIVAHDEQLKFDAEDVRIITGLAGFAAVVLRAMQSFEAQREQAEISQAQAELQVQLNAELQKASETDGTLRHEAEQRAEMLEELSRLKDDLLATVSHDLKSPLASIKAYAQLLLRTIGRPAPDLPLVAQGLKVIDRQTDVMTRLLDNLLDSARIQAGAFELRTQPCDLRECLASVLADLPPEDRSRVDPNLPGQPLTGRWERRKIEQVLANLLSNALKYSAANQQVQIEAEKRGGEISVTISDEGVGIPAAELPGLFERFHRTPQAQASGLRGIGLGLFISRGIVEAHGGHIWAESPGEGQGTTFRFTLPNEPPPGAAGPQNRRVKEET